MENINEAYEQGLGDGKIASMEHYSLPKIDALISDIESGDSIEDVLKSLKFHRECYKARLGK